MTRLVAVTLLSFALLVGAASGTGRSERIARTHCREGMVTSCIHRAAIHYHVSYSEMLYIAHRESRFHPRAVNPQPVCGRVCEHASGVFQFLPSTYATTPYRHMSIFSAKWNSMAAGWYMHHYGFGAWKCC